MKFSINRNLMEQQLHFNAYTTCRFILNLCMFSISIYYHLLHRLHMHTCNQSISVTNDLTEIQNLLVAHSGFFAIPLRPLSAHPIFFSCNRQPCPCFPVTTPRPPTSIDTDRFSDDVFVLFGLRSSSSSNNAKQ